MSSYAYLVNEWWYVLILICIMVISGVIKQNQLFTPLYRFILTRVKNTKFLIILISLFGGILPIPGRVIISAGLLDTVAPEDPSKRSKFGIIDYLATHHYYLWSPLEKTILIPMAVLKLSYLQILSYTWPLIVISLLFLIVYIWTLDSSDVSVRSVDRSIDSNLQRTIEDRSWYQFIKWDTILVLICVVVIGNYIKQNGGNLKDYIEHLTHDSTFIWISIVSFVSSFILGSSSKFAGITALLTSIFGLPYLTYLFAIEFAGYLLSPCHKCVAIGMKYFNTPILQYYGVILIWCILLIAVGTITLFV